MSLKIKYLIRVIITFLLLGISIIMASYFLSYVKLRNVESNLYNQLDDGAFEIKEKLNIKREKLEILKEFYEDSLKFESLKTLYLSSNEFTSIEIVDEYTRPLSKEYMDIKIDDSHTIRARFNFPVVSFEKGNLYIFDNNKVVLNGDFNISEYLNNEKNISVIPFQKLVVEGKFFTINNDYYVYKEIDEALEISAIFIINQNDVISFNKDTKKFDYYMFAFVTIIGFICAFIWTRMIRQDIAISKIKNIDEVTGLYRLQYMKKKLSKKSKKGKYTILCFDIRHFRLINDAKGREFGDEVLRKIANTISSLGKEHLCARGNSDIFYLCYFNCKNAEQLYIDLSNKLYEELKDCEIDLVFDCGCCSEGISNVDEVLDHADMTRKLVKNDELNHFLMYESSLLEKIKRRNNLISWAPLAMQNNEFEPYFQAKALVTNKTLEYHGAEALVRWRHEDSMISPGEFIPLFEENGFIVEFDMYMFERICQRLSEWNNMNVDYKVISVNFSRRHLSNPNFVKKLNEITKKYGIAHSQIEIEILEGVFVDDYRVFNAFCNNLKQYNYRIAIDDFGSGYSSLNALKYIKADVVKIDQGFFLNKKSNSRRKENEDPQYKLKEINILKGIVQIIADSNMSIVFEGIENEEILKKLHKLLVEYVYQRRKKKVSEVIEVLPDKKTEVEEKPKKKKAKQEEEKTSIVDISKLVDNNVVIEETKESKKELIKYDNVDRFDSLFAIQGYYYARPESAIKFQQRYCEIRPYKAEIDTLNFVTKEYYTKSNTVKEEISNGKNECDENTRPKKNKA